MEGPWFDQLHRDAGLGFRFPFTQFEQIGLGVGIKHTFNQNRMRFIHAL